jgi:adenylate cyclase
MRQYGINDNSHDIISLAGLGATKFNPAITLPEGLHYINFQGPATTYPDLPIEEIFMDRVFYKSPKFEFGNIFKNKLVFVGPEAESLHDTHGTPYGEMPGVEIHTQIAGSLLQGTMLHDPPDWLALVLSIPMALVAVWASLKMTHALALSGVLAGGIVLFITVAQLMFLKGNMMIPMVAPLIAFAGSGFFGLVFNFLLEQMERARILSFFEKYVSKNVAELVLSERDEFEKSLLGEKRLVTVLFSDIRGFTTMTEDMVPANLVEQLNEYFYNMVEAVLTAEGTLQQFIGDAIMAIWGNIHIVSPYEGARLAIRTSLKMSAVLDELNAEWAKNPSRVVFNTGIGINHGEVIVGSLGHPQRMEFTTIGDGINTAARLESATKHFGCRILVGEAVEELTRNEFHYRRVGLVQFKGKSKTIEVFTPLGESSEPSPGWLQSYNRAVDLYRRREFRMAQAAFAEARVKMGCKDRLCEMYLKECETYQSNPPAADWTGAWLLTEK